MARGLLVLAAAALAAADDFETVRERARWAYCWPTTASGVASTVAAAQGFASALNASGYFPDINYADQTRANWLAFNHVSRVQTMVTAITVPTSPVFQDAKLSAATHLALGAWLFHKPTFSNPNWWYEWIGMPVSLGQVYLMLGQNRTTPEEQAQLEWFSFQAAWWLNDYGGGDNLSDMLRAQVYRSLAQNNLTGVQQGFATLFANIQVGSVLQNWQGVQVDASFHFHGQQLMNSAYGLGWVQTMLQFYGIVQGTQWDMSPAALTVLAQFIAEGDLMLTFGSSWDFGTQGRGVDRPGLNFLWGLPTPIIRTLANTTAGAPWADALLNFADRVDGIPTAPVVASKVFHTSFFVAHHRPTWGASVKMHGANGAFATVAIECDNSENIMGQHLGDGVLNVYPSAELGVAQSAYFEIFPLLDWNSINGITVEHDTPIDPCNMGTGDVWPIWQRAFVGGATDGVSSVAAMDSATHNFTGQRAWFFLDDAIIALAGNMSDPSTKNVRTTLASRLLPQGADGDLTAGFANGTVLPLADGTASYAPSEVTWLAAGGVGIVPSWQSDVNGPQSVGLDVGTKTGSYLSIGPYPGNVTGRLWTAWLDHGRVLQQETYAYALLPNVSAAAMPAALASVRQAVPCTTNAMPVQGVAQHSENDGSDLAAAVFWAQGGGSFECAAGLPSGALSVQSNSSGIVLVRVNATHVAVTVAHPEAAAAGSTVNVTVNKQATGAGCAAGSGTSTVFSVTLPTGDYIGASATLACEL